MSTDTPRIPPGTSTEIGRANTAIAPPNLFTTQPCIKVSVAERG
jgi:hypothetical protein